MQQHQASGEAKLAGQAAFITGAGRGIGAAIAKTLGQAGARVALVARTAPEVQGTALEIKASGGRAMGLVADVSCLADVESAVATVLAQFGHIDILVNCAGILGPVGRLVDNAVQSWIETVQVNLFGTMFCLRAILPQMIHRRSGVVINLSGGGSVEPLSRFSAYGASKTAVVRLTETIAEEVKEYGIRVNAIAPGIVSTRMLDQTLAAGDAAGADYHAKIADLKARGGVPAERAAELAVFLASQQGAGITGKLISAVWDDWRSLSERPREFSKSSMFTLRRIDGRRFTEIE